MSVVFQSEYPNIQIVKDAVMKAKYHTDVYDGTSGVKGPDLFVAQVFLGSVRHEGEFGSIQWFYWPFKVIGKALSICMSTLMTKSHTEPAFSFEDDEKIKGCFNFVEGEGHNQLTLTDETEIEALREYISHVPYVTELTGEEETEEEETEEAGEEETEETEEEEE